MKYNQLMAANRRAIEVLFRQNYTLTAIVKAIGFSKSAASPVANR
jgi:IS30 family transposase